VSLISSWLAEAAERSATLGLYELQQALVGLAVPGQDAPESAWLKLAEDLRGAMTAQRDIGQGSALGEESVEQLLRYLQANRLLLDCLHGAYVSDREAIADGLLLVS
jgi:hypothetical protein